MLENQTLSSPKWGRLFAAGLLLGAWTVGNWERRSPLAQARREQRPILFWLALQSNANPQTPWLFLAVYQPQQRSLDLGYIPDPKYLKESFSEMAAARRAAAAMGKRLAPLVPAEKNWSALPLWHGVCHANAEEPTLAAREWILERTQGLRFWRKLVRQKPDFSLSTLDAALLSLELHRLKPENLRPAWLASEKQVAPWLGRCLLAGQRPPRPQRVTVEILNASARPGIASQAKNILRLHGADVMSVGNTDRPYTRTVVYDRVGSFYNAAVVRRMLGCPQAQAATRLDLKRLVDVTVVLAADCPLK